jgi:ribosomal protein S6
VEDDKIDKEIKTVEKVIGDVGEGTVRADYLGKKNLAYPVAKQNEAHYVCYTFDAKPSAILTIKQELKHSSTILRSVFFLKEN